MWTIAYADGAANQYRFAATADGVDFEYDPVRPEQSSTGMYSGGDPHTARLPLSHPLVVELRARVERLAADTAHHQADRGKGTGQFTVINDDGTRRDFIVAMGPLVTDFDAFVRGFRRV
jgi:hypothetical protein